MDYLRTTGIIRCILVKCRIHFCYTFMDKNIKDSEGVVLLVCLLGSVGETHIVGLSNVILLLSPSLSLRIP